MVGVMESARLPVQCVCCLGGCTGRRGAGVVARQLLLLLLCDPRHLLVHGRLVATLVLLHIAVCMSEHVRPLETRRAAWHKVCLLHDNRLHNAWSVEFAGTIRRGKGRDSQERVGKILLGVSNNVSNCSYMHAAGSNNAISLWVPMPKELLFVSTDSDCVRKGYHTIPFPVTPPCIFDCPALFWKKEIRKICPAHRIQFGCDRKKTAAL